MAELASPSRCAIRITSSHWSELHFSGEIAVAHFVDENFAAAAGNRAESRLLEARDDFFQRHAENLREMVELGRRKAVDVDRRMIRPDVLEQVEVVIDAELRMMAALHENLRAADGFEFLDLCADLLGREDVAVVVALGPHEGAELAVDVADVRVIDVPVDDVGDDLVAVTVVGRALALAAARVGQFAEFGQRREIELLRLLGRDASAVEDLVFDFGIEQGLDHGLVDFNGITKFTKFFRREGRGILIGLIGLR